MSQDGRLEFFSVIMDQAAIVKRIVKQEKRQNLKRAKQTSDTTRIKAENGEEDEDKPTEVKVDKAEVKQRLQSGDYDKSIHFAKRAVFETETNSKPRSFLLMKGQKKHHLNLYVSMPAKNSVNKYVYDLKKEEKEQNPDNAAGFIKSKVQLG